MGFSAAFGPAFRPSLDNAGKRGWWDPGGTFTAVAAYQAKGAESLAASYTNLVTPGTYNAAPGTAPTFDASTGWTFNGSTQYLTTGIVPDSTWSMFARFSNMTTGRIQAIAGTVTGDSSAPYFIIIPTLGNPVNWYISWGNDPGTTASFSATPTSGVVGLAANNYYFDGTLKKTYSGSWTGGPPHAILIAAQPTSTTPYRYYLGKIQALAIYSTTLSETQVATLTNQMNAL